MLHNAWRRIVGLTVVCVITALLISECRVLAQQGNVFSSGGTQFCVIVNAPTNFTRECQVQVQCPKGTSAGYIHTVTVPCDCIPKLHNGDRVIQVGQGAGAKLITSPALTSALANGAIDVRGSAPDQLLNDLGVLAKTPTGQSLLSGIADWQESTGSQAIIESSSDGSLHTNPGLSGPDLNSDLNWARATSPKVLDPATNPTGEIFPGNPERDAQGNWNFKDWESHAFKPTDRYVQPVPLMPVPVAHFLGTGTSGTLAFDPSHPVFQQYPNLRAIGLGHELIHALHFMTGTAVSWPGWNSQTKEYDDKFPWREEYRTIADPSGVITENNFRHDFNKLYGWSLPDRQGESKDDFLRGVLAGVAAPDGSGC
jgi:hypothetical protein